jgi:hypothetical protein
VRKRAIVADEMAKTERVVFKKRYKNSNNNKTPSKILEY